MVDVTTVVVGVLAFLGTIAGSYFSNNKTVALISYRIDKLEEKVNKHNEVIERTAVLEKDMKTVYHIINDKN